MTETKCWSKHEKKSFIFRYIYLTYFFRFKIKNLKLDKKKAKIIETT